MQVAAVVFLLLALPLLSYSQDSTNTKIKFSGSIQNQEGELLSFCNIAFKNFPIGTTTNQEGMFSLIADDEVLGDTLIASYVGYELLFISVLKPFSDTLLILNKSMMTLSEVVVRPQSPQYYIREAVKRFPKNYRQRPFNARSYYHQNLTENQRTLHQAEAIVSSHFTLSNDTTNPNQHRVLLFREPLTTSELTLFRDELEKEHEKEMKKAAKNGEEVEEFDLKETFSNLFGGPDLIFNASISLETDVFLDSIQFRKFDYSFGTETVVEGRKAFEISVEGKRKMDHEKISAILLLDAESLAIIDISYKSKVIIPLWVRPILFVAGVGIKNPRTERRVVYTNHQETYFPKRIELAVNLDVTQRKLFSKNKNSIFIIKSGMIFNELEVENPTEIPVYYRYEKKKKLNDQVYPIQGVSWKTVNTL